MLCGRLFEIGDRSFPQVINVQQQANNYSPPSHCRRIAHLITSAEMTDHQSGIAHCGEEDIYAM